MAPAVACVIAINPRSHSNGDDASDCWILLAVVNGMKTGATYFFSVTFFCTSTASTPTTFAASSDTAFAINPFGSHP